MQASLEKKRKLTKSQWIEHTLEIIGLVAEEKRKLSTDDIWPYVEHEPAEPRWMGDAIKKAQKLDWIQKTSVTIVSKRPECNSRDVRVWKSLIYEYPSS